MRTLFYLSDLKSAAREFNGYADILWSIASIDLKTYLIRLEKRFDGTFLNCVFFSRGRPFFFCLRTQIHLLSSYVKCMIAKETLLLCRQKYLFVVYVVRFGYYWRHRHQTLSARIDFSIKYPFFYVLECECARDTKVLISSSPCIYIVILVHIFFPGNFLPMCFVICLAHFILGPVT